MPETIQLHEEALADAVDLTVEGKVSDDIDLDKYEFVPWEGRILVERFTKETLSRGGLHLPDMVQEKKNWGKVVKLPERLVSPQQKMALMVPPVPEAPQVAVGDIVVWLEGAGEPMDQLGENLLLLTCTGPEEHDFLGVFRQKKE